jgi:hypothetical protein
MYCKKCGIELTAEAKFCRKCGEPVKTISPQTIKFGESKNLQQRPGLDASISITRTARHTGSLGPIFIYVDGEYSAKVDNGRTVNIPISHGTHQVYVSAPGVITSAFISDILFLQILPGKTEVLTCGYTGINGVFLSKSA